LSTATPFRSAFTVYIVSCLVSSFFSGIDSVTTADVVPLLVAGSIGTPANSDQRSEDRISAIAGTGASTRKRTRVCIGFGAMSGISNTKSETPSLRPPAVSMAACAMLTLAVRPVMRTRRPASVTAGKPSTGRSFTLLAMKLMDRPSSGIGGPPRASVCVGALMATSARCSVPPSTRSSTHSRTSGLMITGHMRLSSEAVIGVPAKPAVSRGSAVE
jgi:hypothetical protein